MIMLEKLPKVEARVSTSVTTKDGGKRKRRNRDAGDVLAKKRAQQFRKRDSNSRHFTGIVNQAFKNKLTNAEKLMDKNHKLAERRISRMKTQLRDELYDMQVSKRALKTHSLVSFEPESQDERGVIEKFSARGRYLYAIRKETKVQRDIMEAFNERLEVAQKLLKPARRESETAMDLGAGMGSKSPTKYFKIGRRLSHHGKLPPLDEYSDDDSEIYRELQTIEESKKTARRPPVEEHETSTPKPDIVQIRSELGPELRMALDRLELKELSHLSGTESSPWQMQSRISTAPTAKWPTGPDKQDLKGDAAPVEQHQDGKGRLTLPPVILGKQHLVGTNKIPKLAKDLSKHDSKRLSTVVES